MTWATKDLSLAAFIAASKGGLTKLQKQRYQVVKLASKDGNVMLLSGALYNVLMRSYEKAEKDVDDLQYPLSSEELPITDFLKGIRKIASRVQQQGRLAVNLTDKGGNMALMAEALYNRLTAAHEKVVQEKPTVILGYDTEEIGVDADGHTIYSAPIPRTEIPKEDFEYTTDENDPSRWTRYD